MKDLKYPLLFLSYYTSRDINNILVLLSKAFQDVRNSGIKQELFEITLIKLVHYKDIIQPSHLLKQLEELKYCIDKKGEEKNPVISETAGNNPEVNGNRDVMKDIISYFSRKRRAIAEFLSRAKDWCFENNLLTVYYGHDERLSYEHVDEESARRYIENEIKNILKSDVRISFVIEKKPERGEEDDDDDLSSPDISKVLEIFKGEIVPKNTNGGA
jgi:hypothetical protein